MSSKAERTWAAQWREAGKALAEQRARELATMTDEEALAASEAVLALAALAPLDPRRLEASGLVEQQALLHRHRPH